jgi:MFS family permease
MQDRSDFQAEPQAQRTASMHAVLPLLTRLLRVELLVLLLIFAVFHYLKLSTFSIAIDDEYEAFRSNGYNWILTGRWSSYLFLRYLVPQPILPFFPAFLFGIGLVLSYALLLSCFGVRRLAPVHYFAFGIYAGFPTWMFLTSLTTACCWAGAAQLAVVIAVDRYRCVSFPDKSDLPQKRRTTVLNALLCVGALAVAMGFYQAYFPSFLVLGMGMLLLRADAPLKQLVMHMVMLGVLAVLGVLLHAAIDAAFRYAFGLQDLRYIKNFLDLSSLFKTPLTVLRHTAESAGAVYGGHAAVYGSTSVAFPFIILAGATAVALWPTGGTGRWTRLALVACILGAPFALHIFNGGRMPLRTFVAVPVVFWLFAMLGLTSRVRAVALVALFATGLGLLQMLYSSNLYVAAGYFARIHDQELASAVYARIAESQPEFDSQKTYTVDFFGSRPFATHYPRPYSSTLGFSYFEWDGGNEERILDYMRLIGYTNLQAPSLEQRRQDLAEFARMPTWPARDSVRVVGDVILVKLGSAPGFPFNVP